MEFAEQLELLKPEINWKVTLLDEQRIVYRQIKKTFFEKLTLAACKMYVRDVDGFSLCTPATINSLVQALLEDSERMFDNGLFLVSRQSSVGFYNGVFDLKIGKMRKYYATDYICDPLPHILPIEYDPDVEKRFVKILKAWVGPEVGDWFLTLLAYFLFIFPNKEHIWLNLFGAGSNGKSVCIELLEKIVGDDKVIGCDLKNLNRFSGEAVAGKWLVMGRDSSSLVSETATSFIKTFSGDEKVLVEHKGGASYDAANQGKLIVSTNSLIQSKDRSYAWYRRLIPIPFPNAFPRDERFKTNLFKQLPELIRVLLHRAYLYYNNETSLFSCVPAPVEALRKETRMLNDRVTAFWEEFFHSVDDNTKAVSLNWHRLAEIHNKSMSGVYAVFDWWHGQEFGDVPTEPTLKTFGGAYGAFLSTEAGRYFEYKRTKYGRMVMLKSEYMDHIQALGDDAA